MQICIQTFSTNTALLETLQHLPSADFTLFHEGSSILPDVIITDPDHLQFPEYFHQNQVILFVEDIRLIHQVFQLSQQRKINAVITESDLSNLASIISQAVHSSPVQSVPEKAVNLGISSTQGGVGKSLVSLHLTYFLSQLLKQPCLLIDLSTPFSSAREYLKYPVHQTWETLKPLLKEAGQLPEERLKATVDHTPFGCDFLAGSDHTNQQITPEELALLLDSAEKAYPIVIVDLPTNSELSELFNTKTRSLIHLMSPESLGNSLKWLNQNKNTTAESKDFWLVNQLHSTQEAKVISKLVSSVQAEFLGFVDEDREAVFQHKKSHQLLTQPKLLLADQFQSIAKELMKRLYSARISFRPVSDQRS